MSYHLARENKFETQNIEVTLRIVTDDAAVGHLSWEKHILVELSCHEASACASFFGGLELLA